MELVRFYDNRALSKTASFMMAFLFCQPVFTAIPIILRIPTEPFSIFFRVIIVLLSLYISILYFFTRKNPRFLLSPSFVCVIIFWVIYSIRLVYDISIRGLILDGGDPFFIYSIAFGNQLLPLVAIGLVGKYIVSDDLVSYLYIAFTLSCISAFALVLSFTGFSISAFSNRSGIGSLGILVIKLSFDGQILIIISVYMLVFYTGLSIWKRLLLIASIFLGVLGLLSGASRSPFFGTFLGLLSIAATFAFANGFKIITILKLTFFSLGIICLFALVYVNFLADLRIDTFVRVASFIQFRSEGAMEIRDFEYQMAWNQFLRSPIIGDAYIEEFTNFYPHNIVLELLMATGIVGTFFILTPICRIFIRSRFLFDRFYDNKGEILLLIIFLLILFLSLFSGGLFANPIFWIFLSYLAVKIDLYYPNLKTIG